MPDSNIADDGTLTSSFYNTYIREQVVVTCTSGTRPTGVEGRLIYETDTDLLRVYDGSTWQRVANDSGQQVVAGSATVTHTAGDSPSISFGVTFATSPVVSATVVAIGTTAEWTTAVKALSTTAFTVRTYSNGSAYGASVTIHWIAVGRIA